VKIIVGQPFNIIQYWFLHKMIAKEVGIDPGDIIFSITIPHIYDRHIDTIKDQINQFKQYNKEDPVDNKFVTIDINDDASFYNVSFDDLKVIGYDQFNKKPLQKYQFEISI
jgi:thymidylate synthase